MVMAIQHKCNLVPELGHIVHDMVTDWVSTGFTETIRETGQEQRGIYFGAACSGDEKD